MWALRRVRPSTRHMRSSKSNKKRTRLENKKKTKFVNCAYVNLSIHLTNFSLLPPPHLPSPPLPPGHMGAQACPKCGLAAVRVSGCAEMQCSRCKSHWTWDENEDEETKLERIAFWYPR